MRAAQAYLPKALNSSPRFGFVPGVKSLGTGDKCRGAGLVDSAKLIHKPWSAIRNMPNRLNGLLPKAFSREEIHELPGAAAAILPQGRVLGREGVVFDRDGFLIAEPARQISSSPFDWQELYRILRPKPVHIKGRWGLLTGCGCHGYFHWMLDVLPKMVLIQEVSPKLDGWLVGGLSLPFVRQSLELMGIPIAACREMSPEEHFVADELVVASCPSIPGNPPQWAVDFLRTMIPVNLDETADLPRRFVISRKNVFARNIENEDELLARLAEYQFAPVVLEEMTLLDQIRLFANAEMIVAPHGAGLTNLAFASSDVKVLEIFGDDYVNVCFWALADIRNLNYSCLVSKSIKKKNTSSNSGGIKLSQACIEKIVSWCESEV